MKAKPKKILCRAKRMIVIYLRLRQMDMTLSQLAKRFKVNERSIQRDLKLLREAGAPIEKGDFGFYVDKKRDYEKI